MGAVRARRGVAGTLLPSTLDALLGNELDGLRDATQEDTGAGRHENCHTLRRVTRRVMYLTELVTELRRVLIS